MNGGTKFKSFYKQLLNLKILMMEKNGEYHPITWYHEFGGESF